MRRPGAGIRLPYWRGVTFDLVASTATVVQKASGTNRRWRIRTKRADTPGQRSVMRGVIAPRRLDTGFSVDCGNRGTSWSTYAVIHHKVIVHRPGWRCQKRLPLALEPEHWLAVDGPRERITSLQFNAD